MQKSELLRIFEKASIFVNSTLFETFGITVAEALGAGLPVIASNIGPINEILDEKCGILVPPDDPIKLAEAIEYLLGNDSVRKTMGKNGREKVINKFSWDNAAKETLKAYECALEKVQ